MPSLSMTIDNRSPLAKAILQACRDRQKFSSQRMGDRHKHWRRAEDNMAAFLPEREIDAKRRLQREQGGKPQYTTIVVPYTYAVLMTAHTYWTTVFMARTPVFQYSGRHGEGEQQTQAIEALIDYQVQVGGMMVPLYLWLMDVGKYGVGVVGNYWTEEISYISEIVEKQEMFLNAIPMGPPRKVKQTRPIPGYQGNKLYNIRPYDFYPDPRVPMARFQDGEFCAVYCELSWSEIKRREAAGYYFNTNILRNTTAADIGERPEGSSQIQLPDVQDGGFEITEGMRDTNPKALFEVHVNLVPSEWKLGKSDFMEKWVFTADKTFSVLIGAQPLGAIHNKFPFNVLELEPEAYGLFSRSLPDIVEPLQNTIDWLLNSHFWNVRKTLNDMFVVDPSRVVMRDFLDTTTEAGLMIRLKPRAYGQDPKTVISQLPVIDVTRQHISDINFIMELGQRVTGVNDQIMGMVSGGGRRTAAEVRTSTTFGVNRLKTSSEYFSAMGWTPLSQMLVQNSQQYYEAEKQFRIVGDLALLAGPQFANVTPDSIQGFFDFVPVDGTLPADRFAQANLWRELFAQMRNFPQLMLQYDISKIFAWVAQLSGLKNINQFRVQLGSPEYIANAVAQGNVVPLGGGSGAPKRGERDLGRVSEPGQVSGMGTTG